MYGGYNNRGRGRGRGGSNFNQWSQQPAHRQPPREGDEKIPPGQWPIFNGIKYCLNEQD
jgi:hypothetical protein